MKVEGGCYCGAIRYRVEGEAVFKGQCHCRECQYFSGGAPNILMGVPEAAFTWLEGTPEAFRRQDLEKPVTREFCPACGTQLLSRAPGLPGIVILKVGTLDDPSVFGMPQMAIFTCDQQPFHQIPDGVARFERGPG